MNITEIRVKLVSSNKERLRAFCCVTLDGDFVVRDLKVIEGTNGPFVAMPSRKLADRCPQCGYKNHLRARHCNDCGARLQENRPPRDSEGRVKLHADVAHPINAACRERLQAAVIDAYRGEMEQANQPGYEPHPHSDDGEWDTSEYHDLVAELRRSAAGSEPHPAKSADHPEREGGPAEREDAQHAASGSSAPQPSEPLVSPPEGPAPSSQKEDDFGAGIV